MIIDGRKLADGVLDEVREEIKKLGLDLKLGIIMVGDNPASLSYVSQKKDACLKTGVKFSLHRFSKTISKEDLLIEISKVCHKSSSVIIQLPLPTNLDGQDIFDAVPFKKDADLLSTLSLGRYYSGDRSILPPTVAAIAKIIGTTEIKGKHAVVIGSGRLVGRPLTIWLMGKGATLSVLNSSTLEVSEFTKKADIVVSGTGRSNLITGDMVKKGAIVIDAGTSIDGGSVKGDINIKSVSAVASMVSPVPGGVGPLTTAYLIANMVELIKRDRKNII